MPKRKNTIDPLPPPPNSPFYPGNERPPATLLPAASEGSPLSVVVTPRGNTFHVRTKCQHWATEAGDCRLQCERRAS